MDDPEDTSIIKIALFSLVVAIATYTCVQEVDRHSSKRPPLKPVTKAQHILEYSQEAHCLHRKQPADLMLLRPECLC